VRERIREYINKLASEKNISVNDDTDLFESGVLDSMGILQLLLYINDTLGITIPLEDLQTENFQTINAIIKLVN